KSLPALLTNSSKTSTRRFAGSLQKTHSLPINRPWKTKSCPRPKICIARWMNWRSSDRAMELKYQYSEADAREAVVAFRKRVFAGRQRKLAIVIVLILICFLLLYLLNPYSRWFYFLSGFFLGVMVLTI